MFRDSCVCVDNFYIKNLDVIDRDPKNVVIVDNASYSFAYLHSYYVDHNWIMVYPLYPITMMIRIHNSFNCIDSW